MLIYEWNIIFITVYSLICNIIPLKNLKKLSFIILSSTHLFIVQGLRSQFVGGDLPGYYRLYYELDTIKKVLNGYSEIGYSFLTMTLSKMGIDFQFFILLVSFFSIIVLSIFIYKYSAYPYISYLLYLFFGIYDFGFSGLRQVIAMSLILIAFDKLNSKNISSYFIYIIVASFFHVTALFFLVIYLISCNNKTRKVYMYIYPIIIIIILLFGNQIVYDLTLWFNPALITSYTISFADGFGMDEILIVMVFILGVGLKYFNSKANDNMLFDNLLISTSIALIFQLLSPYSYYFVRLNLYYYHFIIIFTTIIINQILDLFSNKQVLLSSFFKIIIFGLVLLIFFNFYQRYLGTNPHLIIPHSFFWE